MYMHALITMRTGGVNPPRSLCAYGRSIKLTSSGNIWFVCSVVAMHKIMNDCVSELPIYINILCDDVSPVESSILEESHKKIRVNARADTRNRYQINGLFCRTTSTAHQILYMAFPCILQPFHRVYEVFTWWTRQLFRAANGVRLTGEQKETSGTKLLSSVRMDFWIFGMKSLAALNIDAVPYCINKAWQWQEYAMTMAKEGWSTPAQENLLSVKVFIVLVTELWGSHDTFGVAWV